jgi:hypothetical protein
MPLFTRPRIISPNRTDLAACHGFVSPKKKKKEKENDHTTSDEKS